MALEYSSLPDGRKLYKVILRGGPADGLPSLCTYGANYVICAGRVYTLNAEGEYVYAPSDERTGH